jgi:hydroxymethylbilane synthase
LRIGTRGSALALWQAERVRARLAQGGVAAELVIVRTSGDEGSQRLAQYVEGKGLFTKELEDALLAGRIDAAVHSLKDLGAVLPAGLVLAAFPEREDPRDAIVTRGSGAGGIGGLPSGARVGTSSVRRVAMLRANRSDLDIVALRGNVTTRVNKVRVGELDGAVLAMAGLNRLGLAAGALPLDPIEFVPAPGQGALGVEIRTDDAATAARVAPLDDPAVRTAGVAERAAMAELEGGCRVPLGVVCLMTEGRLTVHVKLLEPDGSGVRTAQAAVDLRDPAACGGAAARWLR